MQSNMSFVKSTFDFAQIMMHPKTAIKKSYQWSTLVFEPFFTYRIFVGKYENHVKGKYWDYYEGKFNGAKYLFS